MAGTPAIGRVSNLMLQQLALGGINRTTLDMFKVQNQLSTGLAVGKYSDDPVKAAVITVLNERLGRSEQVKRNLQHATSALGLMDKTLSDASDLAREAKDIASNQLSFGTTDAERKNQAIVVDQMIKGLFGLANRQSVAGYMFGGSQTTRAPIEEFFGGYRYVGDGRGLVTDLDQASTIPITLGAGSAIGEVSSRVRGSVDLNPNLTTTTRLADLRGGRGVGITLGTVGFSFNGGPTATLDLNGADTTQDVITRLTAAIRQYETDNSVTVLGAGGVSIANGRFSIDVATGGSLQFSEVGTGVTARDLGLVSDTAPFAFTPTSTWGVDVNPKLTWRSPVSSLAGVTGALGTIRINNVGRSALVDLSGASTLQDVRNRIEAAGVGARVEINADGTGIDVFNEVAAGSNKSMSIEEVSGGDTATRLGIRSLSGSTLLSDFNFGRGVGIVKNAVNPITGLPDINYDYDFSVRLGDAAGTVLRFDLQPANMTNVQTMVAALNAQASTQLTAAGLAATDLQFGLATDGNGLRLTQNAGFTGTLRVETMNNSTAATDLGLISGRYDAATTSWIGEDRAKVRVNNLFNALLDLRDSLTASSTSGIGFAGADLETSVSSLAEVRGLVGSYARRVDDASDREGDRNVLDEQVRSQLRDTDFAAAASRFTLLQTQLQAALRTTATSQQLSLLDFLG
jgi:flagellin-like hook-associated protein FlgL